MVEFGQIRLYGESFFENSIVSSHTPCSSILARWYQTIYWILALSMRQGQDSSFPEQSRCRRIPIYLDSSQFSRSKLIGRVNCPNLGMALIWACLYFFRCDMFGLGDAMFVLAGLCRAHLYHFSTILIQCISLTAFADIDHEWRKGRQTSREVPILLGQWLDKGHETCPWRKTFAKKGIIGLPYTPSNSKQAVE